MGLPVRRSKREPWSQHSIVQPSTSPSDSETAPCEQMSEMACSSPASSRTSATGRFDDEQLFYLRARGIPEPDARRLVVRGFFAELIHEIGVPSVEERLIASIEAELEKSMSVLGATPAVPGSEATELA